MKSVVVSAVFIVLLGASASAHAHVGVGSVAHFGDGLAHPLSGLDHLLAAFAVGLWAAMAGGRSTFVWPMAFVGAMALATMAGAFGFQLPFVEPAIALSVLVLGVMLAAAIRVPALAGALLIALFALIHGHTHGSEGGAGWSYLAGLIVATAGLHLAGTATGLTVRAVQRPMLARAAGGLIAAAGAFFLIGA